MGWIVQDAATSTERDGAADAEVERYRLPLR